jgi:hypothetical protein
VATTGLVNPTTTKLAQSLLWVNNYTASPIPQPDARIAVIGTTSGVDTDSVLRAGVWGQADGANPVGVVGRGGITGAVPAAIGTPHGVIGTAADNGVGVRGVANGEGAWGVVGFSSGGAGVVGNGLDGGIALYARVGGRLRQDTRNVVPPVAGSETFFVGEQLRAANGDLWLCVGFGNPGVWHRVATVKTGYSGGSLNLLPAPIRVFDSRTGGVKLAVNSATAIQVASALNPATAVPSGAVAVLGTLTLTECVGPSGYLTAYATGTPDPPVAAQTSNVNWFGSNQNLATSFVCRLDSNGRLTIRNGFSPAASNPTHAIVDIAAFVI